MGMLMRRHRQKATVEPLPVPSKSAAKGAWIEYALSLGISEEEFKGLKRDEIIDLVNASVTDPSVDVQDPPHSEHDQPDETDTSDKAESGDDDQSGTTVDPEKSDSE